MGLWEVVNNLTRLRPSHRERYRVAIFGSARAQPGTYAYDEVKRVAAALAEAEARSGRLDDRAAGSRIAWPTSWDQALGPDLLADVELLLGIRA